MRLVQVVNVIHVSEKNAVLVGDLASHYRQRGSGAKRKGADQLGRLVQVVRLVKWTLRI